MYSDTKFQEKITLRDAFGRALKAALDDPQFNGSSPTTATQRALTGKRSTDPILLERTDRPFRESHLGPRSIVLRICAGLHGDRLERALTRGKMAKLRTLIPWSFAGVPRVGFSGRLLEIEVAWPTELHADDIPLRTLRPNVSTGHAVILGYSTAGETVTLAFDQKLFVHALIGGATGSGKSTVLKTILAQLARDPAAQFVILDGKDGRDTRPLAGLSGLIAPIAFEKHTILNALGWLWEEMKRRNQQPEDIQHPPLYCVFDEFDQYTADDKTTARLAYLIAKQGRVTNIHLIWATHNPARGMFLEKATKDQFAVRLGLKVPSYENAKAIMESSTLRADRLLGVGDALIAAPGQSEHLQMCYAEEADLAAVTGHAPQWRKFPEFDLEQLTAASSAPRAKTFSTEESLIGLFAAHHEWSRDKTNRILNNLLGYGMGSERISERLLPWGQELGALWASLQEIAKKGEA